MVKYYESESDPEYECEGCDRLCFGLPCDVCSLCPWCCRCYEDDKEKPEWPAWDRRGFRRVVTWRTRKS